MPRPPRCRRICDVPQVDKFCPNGGEDVEPILLTLDEYEVIRLVDLEQQTHERCAAQMDISRSTVQEIYESARRKIAACLVHGKPLHITGGNYRICGGQEAAHCGRCCRMQRANTEKSGKNFVITGRFSGHSRDELKELIEAHGGKNLAAVSANVDFLVAGEKIGPAKLQKATKLGVRLISEEELLAMIASGGTLPVTENASDGNTSAAPPSAQETTDKTDGGNTEQGSLF